MTYQSDRIDVVIDMKMLIYKNYDLVSAGKSTRLPAWNSITSEQNKFNPIRIWNNVLLKPCAEHCG